MFLFQIFRSFLPFHNSIGFGVSDFIELALTVLLLTLVLARPWLEAFLRNLAKRSGACMILLATLPVALRLALLGESPVPTPNGSDDFSYLLLADTLRHFRLANPPHPLHQFFESIFVLQQPTYSSIFPLGQGIALAGGWLLAGIPWVGVLVSVAALCSLTYWMLRGWTTSLWALAGGLLAVMEFGPLNQWTNCYWGGTVSAIAGCLVFGALPRLRDYARPRDGALLGLGLGMQLLTRPFEFILLAIGVVLFFVMTNYRAATAKQQLPRLSKAFLAGLLVFLSSVGLTFLQNKAVTGSWATLPYMLSRYEYGVPTTFTVQTNPTPHRALTPEQDLDYRAQALIHGERTDTVGKYLERLVFRTRFYRFFLYAPLYLAVAVFLTMANRRYYLWALATLLIFALGTNFYPYFYPHYIAAVTALFVLLSVEGLKRINGWKIGCMAVGRQASRVLVFVCATQFIFWYGLHLFATYKFPEAFEYETWDYINYGDPEGRIAINRQLASAPGKQLVFVHYGPNHGFHEWVHNTADIDHAQVVWALDLGPKENQKLRRYYHDRTVWLLQPDVEPPQLTPISDAGRF